MTEGTIDNPSVSGQAALWLPALHYYMLRIAAERYEMRQCDDARAGLAGVRWHHLPSGDDSL